MAWRAGALMAPLRGPGDNTAPERHDKPEVDPRSAARSAACHAPEGASSPASTRSRFILPKMSGRVVGESPVGVDEFSWLSRTSAREFGGPLGAAR
jgi:hypothetical protein